MRIFIIAALALIATTVSAETVIVRTGDHEGFTRIVLYAGADQGWSVSEAPGELSVMSRNGARFDLRSAFDKIQRDRVAALGDGGGGTLTVTLNCNCGHRVFPWRGYGLVIDILDDPEQPGAESATAAASAAIASPRELPKAPMVRQQPILQAADVLAIAEIERQVAGALGMPIGGGVTDLPFHAAPAPQGPDVPSMRLDLAQPPKECELIADIGSWGVGAGFVDGLRSLRQSEPGPSGYKADQAFRLARHYLYHGFASEARVALESIDGLGAEGSLLVSLTQILENPGGVFTSEPMMACGQATLLWRFLSDDSLGAYSASDIREIAVQALDIPEGQFSLIHEVLVARLQPLSPEAAAVVRAHARTNGTAATQTRTTDGNALGQFVRQSNAGDPSLAVDVLESLWFQYRGTERGAEFAKMLANDLLSARAFSQLDRVLNSEHFPPELLRDFHERTLIVLATEADDDEFLQAAFKQVPDNYAGRVRRLVAERLSHMGFVDTARTWLGQQNEPFVAPPAVHSAPPQREAPAPGRVTAARQVLDDSNRTLADLREALTVLE